MTDHLLVQPLRLKHHGRILEIPEAADGIARISFSDLCGKPYDANDYLQLSKSIHTLFLTRIPKMDMSERNEARRFITLLDALYESRTKLIISADVNMDQLFPIYSENPNDEEVFAFRRTLSRLKEIQSEGVHSYSVLSGFLFVSGSVLTSARN